ncbi:MAG: DUF1580 domain-containing protein [Isosphaeraceae bacterium]
MFDIATETPITFSQAAALQACRRQGKRVSTVTVWRWATRGVNGIILDTLQTPSGRITSKQALQRFFEALTESRLGRRSTAGSARTRRHRSPLRRQLDSERAARDLDARPREPSPTNPSPRRPSAGRGNREEGKQS